MDSERYPGNERTKWVTLLIMAIAIVVVDTTILNHETKKNFAPFNASEMTQRANEKQLKDPGIEQITYEGDQVWRIWKRNNNSDELVQRYDEDGCM